MFSAIKALQVLNSQVQLNLMAREGKRMKEVIGLSHLQRRHLDAMGWKFGG